MQTVSPGQQPKQVSAYFKVSSVSFFPRFFRDCWYGEQVQGCVFYDFSSCFKRKFFDLGNHFCYEPYIGRFVALSPERNGRKPWGICLCKEVSYFKIAYNGRESGFFIGKLPIPDLIVIDGGKGQVNIARKTLTELQINVPVIGLAKRLEEIYLPGIGDPFNLPKTSPALKLLQRLRDEAHRFAISYHRKLRTTRTLKTSLTDIPGIGKKSAMKLLEHFGSTEQISHASQEQLQTVIGPKMAESVIKFFYERNKPKKNGGT